ncbi:MAG: hypothetical protein OXN23_00855 [Gammaproteobacteria bacterium]|nr:hypothetical protein [Gammaproteobacteria bacterium]MDE0303253.1 hypothetical protein [Gammaproteobacteria bacterium]
MTSRIRACVWYLTLSALPAVSDAQIKLPSSEELGLYYTLGGSRAVPTTPGETLRIKLLPDIQAGATYSCGKFDFRFQVQDILKRLEDQLTTLKSLPEQILLALPGGLFCRAFPGACQLMQYYTIRAGEAYKLALGSCQEIEKSIADRGPTGAWTKVAKSLEWGYQAHEEGNVLEAQEEAESAPEKGLTWVGGRRAGGVGQDMIRPVYDSARAGWCLLNGEPAVCQKTERATEISTLFKTPEEVANWLVDIAGEQAISLVDGTPSPTVPGHGLLPLIEPERQRIEEVLKRLVRTDPVEFLEEDLVGISSRNLVVRREVIDGLQARPDADWRIQRLASELATARVVEKTFLARAALIAGRQEPNVAALDPARKALNTAFERVNHEVDFVLNEVRASHRLASETIRTFIEYEMLGDALKPIRLTPSEDTDSRLIDGGFPLSGDSPR